MSRDILDGSRKSEDPDRGDPAGGRDRRCVRQSGLTNAAGLVSFVRELVGGALEAIRHGLEHARSFAVVKWRRRAGGNARPARASASLCSSLTSISMLTAPVNVPSRVEQAAWDRAGRRRGCRRAASAIATASRTGRCCSDRIGHRALVMRHEIAGRGVDLPGDAPSVTGRAAGSRPAKSMQARFQ